MTNETVLNWQRCLFAVVAAASTVLARGASTLDPVGKKVCLGDMSEFAIIVPAQADKATRHAADFLAKSVKAMCGVALPICETRGGKRWAFVFNAKPLDRDQGYRITSKNGDVGLTGGRRGPFQCVAALVQEDWKARWFSNDMKKPDYRKIASDAFSVVPRDYEPPFALRETCHMTLMGNAEYAVFNGVMPVSYFFVIPEELGGGLSSRTYFCHTYNAVVNGKKYFKNHPEYFPLVNGKRYDGGQHGGQLCYTSDGVADLFVEAFRKDVAEHPSYRLFSVTANDNGAVRCGCQVCKPIIDAEGVSGAEITLANRVARRVKEFCPDAVIDTWGYGQSVTPPKTIRPDENVAILYAPIANRYGAYVYIPWRGEETILKQFGAWREISKKIIVWDYANDVHAFEPNFEVIADNAKYWRETGVWGVFLEECEFNIVPLDRMKSWVYSKLFWNPDYDVHALMDEFIDGYYGPAASSMREYVAVQMEVYRRYVAMRTYGQNIVFSDEDITRMRTAIERAYSSVREDGTYGYRVGYEYVAFLDVCLKGCRRKPEIIVRYEKDLALVQELLGRHKISLTAKGTAPVPTPLPNQTSIDLWKKRLNFAKGGGATVPLYSENAIPIVERNCFCKSVLLADEGSYAKKVVKEIAKNDWGTHWGVREFWMSHENQTEYVVRARLRADIRDTHKPDDVAHGLYLYRAGDLKYMPGADIRFCDLPEDGYGFVYFFRLFMNTPEGSGYFWHKSQGLGPNDSLYYDYLELIPVREFKDKERLEKLPKFAI